MTTLRRRSRVANAGKVPPHELLHGQRGYVLLILLLFVALLSIGMLVAVERLELQVRRDREEELIHRGTQYSRAVGRFVKTLGRYPGSIEELENTNNVRYLRKRYKDPITGKDFRLLHLGDVDYLSAGTPTVDAAGTAPPQPQQALQGAVSKAPVVADGSALNTDSRSEKSESGDAGEQQGDPGGDGTSGPADPSESNPSEAAPRPHLPWSDQLPLTVDHRAILGVVSMSDRQTIREFHGQNRYNKWLFIYTPLNDHAGLLQIPDQRRLDAGAIVPKPPSLDGAPPEQSDPVPNLRPEQPSK